MDISNWTTWFKIDSEDLQRCMSQQTYEPLVNPEGNVFCANYDFDNKYQRLEDPVRKLYTPDVVDWFFENEVYNVLKFQTKSYAPKILDIDQKNKRIFYEWAETCNEVLYSGRKLPRDWRKQIRYIMTDLYNEGIYKLTMYPHCHFIKDGVMKTIDWYGCVTINNPYIETQYMDGIIHESAKFRLEETGVIKDNKYNLEIMYKRSMQEHVKWGRHSMNFIYKEIFNV